MRDVAGHVIQLLNVFRHSTRKYDRHQGVKPIRPTPGARSLCFLDNSVLAAFITPITANRAVHTNRQLSSNIIISNSSNINIPTKMTHDKITMAIMDITIDVIVTIFSKTPIVSCSIYCYQFFQLFFLI